MMTNSGYKVNKKNYSETISQVDDTFFKLSSISNVILCFLKLWNYILVIWELILVLMLICIKMGLFYILILNMNMDIDLRN